MDASQRLLESRHEPEEVDPARPEHRRLEVEWENEVGDDDAPRTYLCRELSRGPDDECHLGYYRSEWEGTFAIVVRFLREARRNRLSVGLEDLPAAVWDCLSAPDIAGTTPRGPASWSYYVHGADLEALRRAGVRLTWSATRLLYAAASAPLERLHAAGFVHGALTARRIRLAFSHRPYCLDPDSPSPPVQFCAPALSAVANEHQTATELAVLATAVGALGTHDDPGIDELLRDPTPSATEALGQRLLARSSPIDDLLRARLRAGSQRAREASDALPALPLDVITATEPELAALWLRVAALDPLLRQAGPGRVAALGESA